LSSKEVPDWKLQEVRSLTDLIQSGRVLGCASLQKVRTAQLQELRRRFKKDVKFRVSKNNLMRLAMQASEQARPGINKLADALEGPNIFLSTDLNPFRLSILLDKSRVKIFAKAGDVAQGDIVVPAGNTGLPPGPIISEFSEIGLATKIETGSVWVVKDTTVCRTGEAISGKLASVLSRLGIKSIESGLTLNAAYDEGLVLLADSLKIDPSMYRKEFEEAQRLALNLAANSSYPTLETIRYILLRGRTEAFGLSIFSGFPTKDTIGEMISRAYREMYVLGMKVAEKNRDAAPRQLSAAPSKEEQKVEKEAEKVEAKPSEEAAGKPEEAAAGLSSLFG